MQEYITEHAVANAIRMKRTVFAGAFLVVEGVSDKLVYGLIVDRETCWIEIAYGRANAIGAVRILNVDAFTGVFAIVDADVANIVTEDRSEDNVFVTDLHDLECMMLNSPAFDRVLEEFGSDQRISAFGKTAPLIARQFAINATPLGCLRLISLQNGLGLKFKGLPFVRFVNAKDLKINVTQMVREVLNNSHKHHLNELDLVKQVDAELRRGHDCWQIACGHDIVGMLSVAFRKTFGGKCSGQVGTDILERCLRLAYDVAYLRETKLYRTVAVWELNNPTFPVLTPP